MFKNYNFPLQIFFILEKASITYWTSKTMLPNNFVIFLNNKWLYTLSLILRNDVTLNKSTLIENSAIDMKYYDKLNSKLDILYNTHRILTYYLFYIYSTKVKLLILLNSSNNFDYPSQIYNTSIDKVYRNANWLERETSEMYGNIFYNKHDTRKLLLDYSKQEHPMLKDFPSEGNTDVFYDFFEKNVSIVNNEIIEL